MHSVSLAPSLMNNMQQRINKHSGVKRSMVENTMQAKQPSHLRSSEAQQYFHTLTALHGIAALWFFFILTLMIY